MRVALALFAFLQFSWTMNAASPSDRLLDAIAQVESGGDAHAVGKLGERGAWQFTRATWYDACKRGGLGPITFLRAHHSITARLVASAHLHYLQEELRCALGRAPQPREVYCAWNLGLSGFAHRRYAYRRCPRATREAALRVEVLCNTKLTDAD